MKTKDKILESARKLFNKQGLKKVSVRDICKDLGISLGNFSYHFPNKDNIVLDLYHKMRAEIYEVVDQLPKDRASVVFFLESHRHIFLIQNKYKFFYLNLFEVLNTNVELKKAYIKTSQEEKEMASALLKFYVAQGVLKEDIAPAEFERMVEVGQIVNNSWAIDAEIHFKGNFKKKLIRYMNLCCGLLGPYLTPKSKKAYLDYFEELEQGERVTFK